ncbi:MAG: tetratricopeptide repeat protein [Deltaproteobacteria bacterium]|nr:tetratricopeptide repeat protein [Deltaproteobacteria bacterium]
MKRARFPWAAPRRASTLLVVVTLASWPDHSLVAQERHEGTGKHVAVFAKGEQQEREGDRLAEAGKRDDAQKAYRQAVAAYQQATVLARDYLPSYLRLSRVYGVLGMHAAAAAMLKGAVSRFPASAALKEQLGIHLTAAGYAKEGVAMLEEVVRAQPKNLAVQRVLATHYEKVGDWAKAAAALTAILDEEEDSHGERVKLGTALLRLRKLGDALEEFRKVPQGTAAYLPAQMGLSDGLVMSGKAAEALEVLRRAQTGLSADSVEGKQVALRVARTLRVLRRFNEALLRYRDYIGRAPKDAQGYFGAGECYREMRNYGQALAQLQYALQLDARSAPTYEALARTYLSQGNIRQALHMQQQAARLSPGDPRQTALLGRLQRRGGNPKKARELHAGLTEQHPTNAEFLTELGHDHYYLGQQEQAVEAYRKAVKLDAQAREARIGLVMVGLARAHQLSRARKLADAYAELEKLLDHNVMPAEVRGAMAAVALEQGDAARAQKVLAGIPANERGDWKTGLLEGRVLVALGKGAAALKVLARVGTARLSADDAGAVELATAAAELLAKQADRAVVRLRRLPGKEAQGETGKALLGQALVRRANLEWEAGRAKNALKDLVDAEASKALLGPEDVQRGRLLTALAAAEEGQRELSVRAFTGFTGSKKPAPERVMAGAYANPMGVKLLRAYLDYRAGTFDLAIKVLEPIYRQRKTNEDVSGLYTAALRQQAHKLYAAANYRGADALATKLRTTLGKPNPADELFQACLQFQMKETGPAMKAFERLAAQVPEARLNLGIFYDEVQKDKKAAYLAYVAYLRAAGGRGLPAVRQWVQTKERIFGFGGGR